jgi:hypothetical protein
VILLSLIAACIALPLLLRGSKKVLTTSVSEVRDAWRKTAEAAIHALEAEEVNPHDAAESALSASSRRGSCPNIGINWRYTTIRLKPRRWRFRWICWSGVCA